MNNSYPSSGGNEIEQGQDNTEKMIRVDRSDGPSEWRTR